MLYNKHSETKQRFGIRKLSIGVTSVLLSTLFLAVNSSPGAQAATTEQTAVASAGDTTGGTDSGGGTTVPTLTNEQSAANSSVAAATANTDSAATVTSTSNADATLTAASASDAAANATAATSTATDAQPAAPAAPFLAAMNLAVASDATSSAAPVLSQTSTTGEMSLSISAAALPTTQTGLTVTLNATDLKPGDTIVIKVRKGSAYEIESDNLPIGTVTSNNSGGYQTYTLNITTSGKVTFKIALNHLDSGRGQGKITPLTDTGVTEKDIQWSVNGQVQAPLSFTQTIIPYLRADTVQLANAAGDANNQAIKLSPNHDYNFVYQMGETNGVLADNTSQAKTINSVVNYGATITIPVPANFLLNQAVSQAANEQQGNTGITITQAGIGQDVVITVPKGSGSQSYENRMYYALTGRFVYDQADLPTQDTTVTAPANSLIEQTYTADGQQITAEGTPFKVIISGGQDVPLAGKLGLGVKGAVNDGTLVLDADSKNDPQAVNWFSYANSSNDIQAAQIELNLADGLHVTGIKTPRDKGTVFNNIGAVQSYAYVMTLTDGQTVSGTVTAGEVAQTTATDAQGNLLGIRKIVLTPNTNVIGSDTKTDDLPTIPQLSDQAAALANYNGFVALGNLSSTYDDGRPVQAKDTLASSITVYGSNFGVDKQGQPIVSYTATGTQTVIDDSLFKADVGTWMYQNSTQAGKAGAGEITLASNAQGNYNYLYEPIFYYVVPANTIYSGKPLDNLNQQPDGTTATPQVSTYLVNGRQIVKVDYTGTHYNYYTRMGANNWLYLDNAGNQPASTKPWEIYLYSPKTGFNRGPATGTTFTAANIDPNQALDPAKFFKVGGGSWKISSASAVVMADAANGNLDAAGLYVPTGKASDKGDTAMSFRVNVVNYDQEEGLSDLTAFINLPVAGHNQSTTTFQLTGPVTVADGTVLYATTLTPLPTGVGTPTPATTAFLTQAEVEAKIAAGTLTWANIKSVAIHYDLLDPNAATEDILLLGQDPTLAQDAGKVAQLEWGLYGGNGMPPLVSTQGSKITISGTSTVKAQLHYTDPAGQDHVIALPAMSKTYQDNQDVMKDNDFPATAVPKELIPQGYQLVIQNGKPVQTILDNGGQTWSRDGAAAFNQTVKYYFDGDTVQFELAPIIDTATETITRTVNFTTTDTQEAVAPAVTVPLTVTQATNEVTGETTYTASYQGADGRTVSVPVTTTAAGQLQVTFPAVDTPTKDNYYLVAETAAAAASRDYTFTFDPAAAPQLPTTVQYAPVQQTVQLQVFDDDSATPKEALDLTATGVTTTFTGKAASPLPAAVTTNLAALQEYYQARGYEVTLPSVPANYDETPNGASATDQAPQVLSVHLKHRQVTTTETIKAVREITYTVDAPTGADVTTPAPVQTTEEAVFSREATTDQVTKQVTYTPWTGETTFAGVVSPTVTGYHPDQTTAGALTATATALNQADEATLAQLRATGVVVADHVTYAPDYQSIGVRVHDDTTDADVPVATAESELGLTTTQAGTSDAEVPAEFTTNLTKLTAYYEAKGYAVTVSAVPSRFDQTANGTAQVDREPQVVTVHLTHQLALTPETATVTRTINYYDQDQNQLIQTANSRVQAAQTLKQTVTFARYVMTDRVTGATVGYATPAQVTTADGTARLVDPDAYFKATGDASDQTAGFVVTSPSATLAAVDNYDLTQYGYEAPTTATGTAFPTVTAVTPAPTDGDQVVNVYYRAKIVTVTPTTPPTPGTTVPNTNYTYPANDWSLATATDQTTRTIHYVYDDGTKLGDQDVSGQPVAGLRDVTQTVTFSQSATVNLVTGEVNYQGDWQLTSTTLTDQAGQTTTASGASFAAVTSPRSKDGFASVKGYTPHAEIVPEATPRHGDADETVLVKYTPNNSLVQIAYIDDTTGDNLKTDKPAGKSNEPLTYTTTAAIQAYLAQGYELVHDGYTANDGNHNQTTFDAYDDVPAGEYPAEINQKWEVHLKHKLVTVPSTAGKASTEHLTTPDGYDHVAPSGVASADLNNVVTRTISFVYADRPAGQNEAAAPVTQTVAYQRDATVDLVKLTAGQPDAVTYGNWALSDPAVSDFAAQTVPVISGYVADYEAVPAAPVTKDATGKALPGTAVVVTYRPVGKIVPVDASGQLIEGADTPRYENDQADPTQITATPTPTVPGYHLQTPSQTTVTPSAPGQDTPVVYVKNTQVLNLVYRDTTTGTVLTTQNEVARGDSGSTIPASATATLNQTLQDYLNQGYVLDPAYAAAVVPTNFDTSDQTATGTDATPQVVTVYLKHDTEEVTASEAKVAGTPINAKDPNGAKYPAAATPSHLALASRQVVTYTGAGEQTPPAAVTTTPNTLTRTVTLDKVTGAVLATSAWTGGHDYAAVATPVVTGYFADQATAGAAAVTPTDAATAENGVITKNATVNYQPLGHLIPVDKTGQPIAGAKTPTYENDPADPTQAAATATPTVPGYHLQDPSQTTVTPSKPGEDTPVVYVADSQDLRLAVYDQDSATPDQPLDLSATGVTTQFTGDSFTAFPAAVGTSVQALLAYYQDRGYAVVTAPETQGTFDGDRQVTQILKVVLKHATVTITGDKPQTPGTPINPADPTGPKYDEAASAQALALPVHRTITYHGDGAQTPPSVETAGTTLTRAVVIDKVTGKVLKTSNWTGTATFAAVTTPPVAGYQAPAQAGDVTVTGATVNALSPSELTAALAQGYYEVKVPVEYTPEEQTLQLQVVDVNDPAQPVTLDPTASGQPTSFTGASDSTLPTTVPTSLAALQDYYLARGYEVVSVDDLPSQFDHSDNAGQATDQTPQTVTLRLKHRTTTVTAAALKEPGTPINPQDPTGAQYPAAVAASNLTRAAQRVVNYVTANGDVVHAPSQSPVQEQAFTRTVTVDQVTGAVVATSDWQGTAAFAEQANPVVDGYYTTSQTTPAVSATATDQATTPVVVTQTVVYAPLAALTPVDPAGHALGSAVPYTNDPTDPTKAQSVTSPTIPGYHLVDPNEATMTPNPGEARQVAYAPDEQHLRLRVIDDTTGATLSPTTLPTTFTGSTNAAVPAAVATSLTQLRQYYEARGYEWVSQEAVPTAYDSDATVDQIVTMHLKHKTVTVSGTAPQEATTPLNPADPQSPTYGTVATAANLTLASQVVINYVGAGAQTPPTLTRTQPATLTRTVTLDQVTGAVVATGPWTGIATYAAVDTPALAGYQASESTVDAVKITPADAASAVAGMITKQVTVAYTPEQQSLTLTVYDQTTDQTLTEPLTFTGVTNGPVGAAPSQKLAELIQTYQARGYEVVALPQLATQYDATENGTSTTDQVPQAFVLVVKHKQTPVTSNDPKTPSDQIPATDQTYPAGVADADLNRPITRTITVVAPDGTSQTLTQTVAYHRDATVDAVTKATTYTPWTTDQATWAAYQAPAREGYHVDQAATAVTVPSDGQDTSLTLHYLPDPQSLVFEAIDQTTGQTVALTAAELGGSAAEITGVTNAVVPTKDTNRLLAQIKLAMFNRGFVFASGEAVPLVFDHTSNEPGQPDQAQQRVRLFFTHFLAEVPATTGQAAGTPITNGTPTAQTYPAGVADSDLNRTITRTIVVHFPAGTSQTVTQVVHYTRSATVDAVTKQVTYGAWTTTDATWPAYAVPVVAGYQAEQASVAAQSVPVTADDVTLDIHYLAAVTPAQPSEPTQPSQPDQPGEPTSPSQPDQPGEPTQPSQPDQPGEPTPPSQPAQLGAARQATAATPAGQPAKATLPQTGNQTGWGAVLAGLGLLILTSLGWKKREDQ